MRTRSGGSSFSIRRPSTTLVSLERACRLSRPRAFLTAFFIFFVVCLLVFAPESRPKASSSPTREYHTSSSPISENSAIRRRYEGAARHNDTRGEAFDVPLPGPRQGLVEVVEVEEQGAFRGSVHAEVQEVGVTA